MATTDRTTPSGDDSTTSPDLLAPGFFSAKTERLQSLLDTVVRESANAKDPDASVDFLQLTEVLSSLLDESHAFALMRATQLRESAREAEIQAFLRRMETVESTVGDWNLRVMRPRRSSSSNSVQSLKRIRSREKVGDRKPSRAIRKRMERETEEALRYDSTMADREQNASSDGDDRARQD